MILVKIKIQIDHKIKNTNTSNPTLSSGVGSLGWTWIGSSNGDAATISIMIGRTTAPAI